jgi:hypothetical protein
MRRASKPISEAARSRVIGGALIACKALIH